MKQKSSFRQNSFDSGFTFIETLISLAIISMMAVVITGGILISLQSYRKARTEIKKANLLLASDTQLRNDASHIMIPYWVSEMKFSFTESSITYSWVDGKEDSQTFSYTNIAILDAELMKKGGKAPSGIRIKYEFDGNVYTASCLFSTFPYGDVKL